MTRLPSILISGLLSALCTDALPAQDDVYQAELGAAQRHLEKGRLSRARSIFETILDDLAEAAGTPDAPSEAVVRACRHGLLRLDLIGGSYDAVIAAFDALPAGERRDGPNRLLAAEALMRRGSYQRADTVLGALIEAAPDDFRAICMRGELCAELGRHDDARQLWSHAVDKSRSASVRAAEDLAWVARAHMNLGGRQNFEQAAGLLVEAIRKDPDRPDARVLYGRLRFDAYGEWSGSQSGEKSLTEVLTRNGDVEEALVELYRIRSTNHLLDAQKTEDYLDRALAVNPNSVPAMVERAVSMIDDRRFREGSELLDQALQVNANDKRALAQRAAAAWLSGAAEAAAGYEKRALAVDPTFVGVDVALGDRLVALYRFGDAVSFYEKALERQPEHIPALHGMGKALLYTGQGKRAVEFLERAQQLQPGLVNPWRNNILAVQALLAQEYSSIETDGLVFTLHRDDVEVLETYLAPYLRDAIEKLDAKYGFEPTEPVKVEVFHTWDDFSVRTIGFRGFTALGACFGPMITLVSPVDTDLRQQDFMWTATAWHEYTHVITLALSKHRVPRWLTEGFSVYEEGQKDKAWERGMDRELFDAYHNGEIAPVGLLNRLFRGPRILFGYYQGGLIVEFLAREHGFDKVVEMLKAYGEDLPAEAIFQRTFGLDTREFDRGFLDYVRDEKLAGLDLVPRLSDRSVQALLDRVARQPDDVASHIGLAWALVQRGVDVDAAHHLRQVLSRDPQNAEAQLVYAELLHRRNDFDAAVEAYEKGFKGGADDFDSRIRYGKLLALRGDLDGAARQFQAAKRCWPSCTDQGAAPSLLLAELYRRQERDTEAMMELQTFCKKTARAFQPRLELAEYAKRSGNRKQEAQLLEQAVQIDPFARSVHLALADAYVALDRKTEAATELQMALAVKPAMDRAYLGKPQEEVPHVDSPEYLADQAGVCVRLARLLRELGQSTRAVDYLERAIGEAPGSEAADEAESLREQWRD